HNALARARDQPLCDRTRTPKASVLWWPSSATAGQPEWTGRFSAVRLSSILLPARLRVLRCRRESLLPPRPALAGLPIAARSHALHRCGSLTLLRPVAARLY